MDIGALKITPQAPVAPKPSLKVDPIPPVEGVAQKAATLQATDRQTPPDVKAEEAPLARQQVVERAMTIDPKTQTMVYQALNARGDVVLQVPDQALLRQRAYDREMAQAAERVPAGHVVVSA